MEDPREFHHRRGHTGGRELMVRVQGKAGEYGRVKTKKVELQREKNEFYEDEISPIR